jgi:hypothetical protein
MEKNIKIFNPKHNDMIYINIRLYKWKHRVFYSLKSDNARNLFYNNKLKAESREHSHENHESDNKRGG